MKKTVVMNPKLMDSEEFDKNHVSEAADILLEAEEIKKDEVLMKAIKKHLEEKKGKITDLASLKEAANNFSSSKEEGEKE